MNEANNMTKVRFWNRVQIVLILIVFAAPIVGAFFYQPTSFGNYGDIYSPVRVVSNLTLQEHGDTANTDFDSFRKKWVFLVFAETACSEVCEANILKMRQLRFMQNNDMSRIRTVFLTSNLPSDVIDDLSRKYFPVEVYDSNIEELQQWRQQFEFEDAPIEAQHNRLYIIDPAGNLMMSYPSSADPSLMKKDIKRLLKTSQIG